MIIERCVLACSIWAILSLSAAGGETKIGSCTIPDGKKISLDGRCGTWKVSNKIEKGKKLPKVKIIVDFRKMRAMGAQFNLTALVYICVDAGHNGPQHDKLYIGVLDSNNTQINQKWEIDAKNRDTVKQCEYLAVKPGMRLSARMTNRKPARTRADHSAKGTWAIVGVAQ